MMAGAAQHTAAEKQTWPSANSSGSLRKSKVFRKAESLREICIYFFINGFAIYKCPSSGWADNLFLAVLYQSISKCSTDTHW